MFGTRRLKRIIKNSKDQSAEEIKNHIVEAAYQYYGDVPQEDDVTLIVGKVK